MVLGRWELPVAGEEEGVDAPLAGAVELYPRNEPTRPVAVLAAEEAKL